MRFSLQLVALLLFLSGPSGGYAQKMYGLMNSGGTAGNGTIFTVSTDGTGFTKIHDFQGNSGRQPGHLQMVEGPGSKLYGRTTYGGVWDWGTLFEFDYVTHGYRLLHSFGYEDGGLSTNGDLMIASNGKIYGTGFDTGPSFPSFILGNIFEYNLATDQFRVVHEFTLGQGMTSYGKFLEYSGKLYGLGVRQENYNEGTLYSYDLATEEFEVISVFGGSLGTRPLGGLALAPNGKMYGITVGGGSNNDGTIFEFDPVSKTVTHKASFDRSVHGGEDPHGTLMLASDGKFYGTTAGGGFAGFGTIFQYDYVTNTLTGKTILPPYGAADPTGTLIQAPNGMIYGLAERKYDSDWGALFQYDPVSNTVTTRAGMGCTTNGAPMLAANGKIYYTTENCQGKGTIEEYIPGDINSAMVLQFDYQVNGGRPYGSLTQAPNGLLYGLAPEGGQYGFGTIFNVNPANDQYTKIMDLPYQPGIPYATTPKSSFVLHPNGLMYATTVHGSPGYGSVIEFNPATNQILRLFPFDDLKARNSISGLTVIDDGRLFGTTPAPNNTSVFGHGALYEVNLESGTIVSKVYFNGSNGADPSGEPKWHNGKLYGVTKSGGTNNAGTLYEYDPKTSQLTVKVNFTSGGCTPVGSLVTGVDGYLYGTFQFCGPEFRGGIFGFDPNTGQIAAGTTFSGLDPTPVRGSLTVAPGGALYGIAPGPGPTAKIYRFHPDEIPGPGVTFIHDFAAEDGRGPEANRLTMIRSTQSITMSTTPISKTYGDADFSITATASSTLPVTLVSGNSSVATVVNNVVHLTGAGTTKIKAYQVGNDHVLTAPVREVTLTVSKSTLQATADPKSKIYGDNNPALTFQYSGLVPGDNGTMIDTPPAISTTAMMGSDAGSYPISLTGGTDNNYNIVLTNSQLTITKATLVATADNQSRRYGQNNVLAMTITGYKAGDDVGDIQTLPSILTTAVTTSPSGDYPITLSGGVDDNYQFQLINGVLSVTKADLEVGVEDAVKAYGTANPQFHLTFSGFVGLDTEADVDVLPTPATSAMEQSAVGTYAIVLTGGSDNNYNLLPTNGTLTVLKASQQIELNSVGEKKFGEPAFALQAVASSGLPVNFTSGNPGVITISGGTATIVGVGTVTITASQPGNDNFHAAENVSTTFEVSRGSQVIIFPAIGGKVFGEPAFALTATSTSELPLTYTSDDPTVVTIAGNTATIKKVGIVSITASQGGNENYQAASNVSRQLEISKASQIITFDPIAPKNESDPPFQLTASSNANLRLTFTSSNSGVATVAGNMVTIVAAGTTTITAIQPGDDNYLHASTTRELVVDIVTAVEPDPITIVSLSPNPVKDELFVSFPGASARVTIHDITNRRVLSSEISQHRNRMSLVSLASGQYIAWIITDDQVAHVRRFVKHE